MKKSTILLAGLLSDFCLDVSKAAFIATAITPAFNQSGYLLTRSFITAIIYLFLAWGFGSLGDKRTV